MVFELSISKRWLPPWLRFPCVKTWSRKKKANTLSVSMRQMLNSKVFSRRNFYDEVYPVPKKKKVTKLVVFQLLRYISTWKDINHNFLNWKYCKIDYLLKNILYQRVNKPLSIVQWWSLNPLHFQSHQPRSEMLFDQPW